MVSKIYSTMEIFSSYIPNIFIRIFIVFSWNCFFLNISYLFKKLFPIFSHFLFTMSSKYYWSKYFYFLKFFKYTTSWWDIIGYVVSIFNNAFKLWFNILSSLLILWIYFQINNFLNHKILKKLLFLNHISTLLFFLLVNIPK